MDTHRILNVSRRRFLAAGIAACSSVLCGIAIPLTTVYVLTRNERKTPLCAKTSSKTSASPPANN